MGSFFSPACSNRELFPVPHFNTGFTGFSFFGVSVSAFAYALDS